MGLFDIFKKKQSTQLSRPQTPSTKQEVDQVLRQTEKQIADGLSKSTASTGTPIDDLHGAAKSIAQISNVGGGSKATGGGGMSKGMETIVKNAQAKTAKRILDNAEQKKLKK